MKHIFESDLNFAKQLDNADLLQKFRGKFYFSDENTIYLDGNSLGKLPLKTRELISETVDKQWGAELIESWNKHWYTQSEKLGNKIARLIGASENEVIVCDSTSVNLYKLAFAAIKFQKGKTRIVSDVFNFPTDLYILEGIIENFGENYELVLANSKDGITIDIDDLKRKITENTALLVLSMVSFKSSFLYNAEKITKWAHEKGALVLWDLSHAAGAVPIKLNQTNADLAVGCTYKYLNGGPGSPAFLYVRKDLQEKLFSPVQGWFGDNKPFAFDLNYQAAKGIRKFLAGTPPVISQMAIEPGLDLFLEAGMENVFKKGTLQTEYFIFLAKELLLNSGFEIGSPEDSTIRGSHVTLKHKFGYQICQALIHPINPAVKIIPDFREPNNIRFGITPLYTTFQELWITVQRLKSIVEFNEFNEFTSKRNKIT